MREDIINASNNLIKWMHSLGYTAARFINIHPNYNEKKGSFFVVIYIYVGDQYIVNDVNMTGITEFNEDEVLNILSLSKDSKSPFHQR